jgi:hypothetical protein
MSAVELDCIEQMKRQDLLAAIGGRAQDLPEDLRQGLEAQPTYRLQLVLLTARLIYVLRHLPPRE